MPRLKIHALAVSAAILMNALPAVPLPARAAAFRPATIEDVRSIQSFVHDSDDYYAQEPADLNGDGCVDVFDLALAKLYYALMQIVITICNPPSLTAGGAQRR